MSPPAASALHGNDSARRIVSDALVSGLIFAIVLTVMQRMLGAVRGILFCRLMTEQELGQFSMIHGFLMMLAPLAVLGLPGCFGRYVEDYSQSRQLGAFLKHIGRVCTLTTGLLAVAIVVFPGFFSQQILGQPGQWPLMYAMAGALVLVTLNNYLTTLVEALRQIRLASRMRFVSGVTFTLLAVVFLLVRNDALAALAGFGLSCLIGAVPALGYLRHRRGEIAAHDQPLSPGQMALRVAPFAAWWWVSNIVHNAFELVDRYMLVHCSNLSVFEVQGALGQYHSSRVVPLLMVSVATMLSGLLLPYVTAAWLAGDLSKARRQMNMTIKLSSLGMLAGNALLLAAGPLIFNVVLQGKYDDGLAILPLTLAYCAWFSLQTVSQDYLWVSERGKFAVMAMAIGLAGNIGLNAVLIPVWGLWGAVIATAAGNLMGVTAMFVVNWRMGCPPDAGCWIGLLFPFALLAGPAWALVLAGAVTGLALLTPIYFSAIEMAQLRELLTARLGRFWRRGA